ncbi:hypothetical protein JW886_07505 [Lactococcus taiwanensis]|uniref:Uncharacterized protein n=1 Tax=Lactococcus taiwanensis TaxID=1151742 RepID=A0AA45KFC0_9LACT|nr:hypothetical protein [Lactococcus taiwanensis]QSE76307.1 hypothetical protein JW886_07505 [Lactococcus taiwanensis]
MADLNDIYRGMQNGAETIDENFNKLNTELESTVDNLKTSSTKLNSDNMSDISIYKTGNNVYIRLVGSLSSKVANGNLIGSIPSGFRPSAEWHYDCFGAGELYRVLVRPDGGLQASQDIPSGTSFRDTINYPI